MPYGTRMVMALPGGGMFVAGALIGLRMIARPHLYEGGLGRAALASGPGLGLLAAARLQRDE